LVGGGGPAAVITVLVEPGTLAAGREVRLVETEAHHLRVRRVRDGARVRLMDGEGQVGQGMVVGDPEDGRVVVEACEARVPPAVLLLAVGSGDRERFGWLVEKAAELGVTDIIPLETERTAGVATKVRDEHVAKLERRAREAIKQSGAPWAPRVHPVHTIGALVARPGSETRWLADADGGTPSLADPASALLVVVGPEGGLSGGERATLLGAGFSPIRLGPHVLRFETAAMAAAVIGGSLRKEPVDA